MKKNKPNTYTCLLLATCFVASPFIFHKIWKTSSEAKKVTELPVSEDSISDMSATDSLSDSEATDVIVSSDSSSDGDQTEVSPDDADEAAGTASTEALPTDDASKTYEFVSGDISYFDDALFIGDSRTVGIEEYGTIKNADYFCSIGMMASKIDSENLNGMNFDQLIDSKQYGKVYVMLGINEVGNDFQFTLTQYRAVVERLKAHQPNAIIIVQGNLHVAKSAETNVINNKNIDYLNSLIEGLADNKKVFYIDINEVYDDSNGCLTEAYTSDGIHPLAKYYKEWCEWLCTKEVAVTVSNADTDTDPTSNE